MEEEEKKNHERKEDATMKTRVNRTDLVRATRWIDEDHERAETSTAAALCGMLEGATGVKMSPASMCSLRKAAGIVPRGYAQAEAAAKRRISANMETRIEDLEKRIASLEARLF